MTGSTGQNRRHLTRSELVGDPSLHKTRLESVKAFHWIPHQGSAPCLTVRVVHLEAKAPAGAWPKRGTRSSEECLPIQKRSKTKVWVLPQPVNREMAGVRCVEIYDGIDGLCDGTHEIRALCAVFPGALGVVFVYAALPPSQCWKTNRLMVFLPTLQR